jgi:hypothetical protein
MSKIIHIHAVGKRESEKERVCVCVPVRPSHEREDWLTNARGAGGCGVGDAKQDTLHVVHRGRIPPDAVQQATAGVVGRHRQGCSCLHA